MSSTASAVSYAKRRFSYSSVSPSTGSRPAKRGLVSIRLSRLATVSGAALSYMIRAALRKSSTEAVWVIHPPPGDNTMPPVVLSSSVRDASNSLK